MPLLLIGIMNDLVWCRLVTQQGLTWRLVIVLVLIAIVAGASTPPHLQWFSAFCLCIPALLMPNYHGALIFYLLAGFIFPPMWYNVLRDAVPLFAVTAGCVWTGTAICRRITLRRHC
jgi:hypothetical protein